MTALDRLTADQPPERHEIGTEDGETCNRYPEPDEDQPRGYKPKPCNGVMETGHPYEGGDSYVQCDTCGEMP